jgi:hypothetical protein
MKGILWLSIPAQDCPVSPTYSRAKHLHVTLQFGAEMADFAHLIGQEVAVKATSICRNGRIEALKIVLPEEFRYICQNEVPHMTISHRADVRPVESNAMLQDEHIEENINFDMLTIVEFFTFK